MPIEDYYSFIKWSFLFLFLPISISFYHFHIRSKEMKVLCLLLYLILFFEIINKILIYLVSRSNLFVFHIYTFIEFYLYCFIFRKHIVPPLSKSFFRGLLYTFGAVALLNMLFVQGFAQFNSYTRMLESLIFISFSVLLLFELFRQEESIPFHSKPLSWFACGILLYFSGNLFVFIFSNFIMERYSLQLNHEVWAFNALMNGLTYLLFAVALWKDSRKL
jgi:hypothetical protein